MTPKEDSTRLAHEIRILCWDEDNVAPRFKEQRFHPFAGDYFAAKGCSLELFLATTSAAVGEPSTARLMASRVAL